MAGFAATVSVALVILYSGFSYGQKNSANAAENVAQAETCDEAKISGNGVSVNLLTNQVSITFKCGADAVLEPDAQQKKFCVESDCINQEPVTAILSGADFGEIEAVTKDPAKEKTYQLTLPEHGRPGKTIYYQCKFTSRDVQGAATRDAARQGGAGGAGVPGGVPGSGLGEGHDGEEQGDQVIGGPQPLPQVEKSCLVTIKIEQTSLPEPEKPGEPVKPTVTPEGLEQVTECDSAFVAAELSADKSLKFRCPNDQKLLPTSSVNVYDDSDGQCSKEVQLSSLVKAALKPANPSSEEEGRKTIYKLTLESPPIHDAALCYKCVSSEANSKPSPSTPVSMRTAAAEVKECSLKVVVKGTYRPASSAIHTWASFSIFAAYAIIPSVYAMM
ncbi:hypothetical protein BESB_033860 [Besnoitia besnoiti]|uniref:SRS domain-containing protein n=1 Tax=Besnoitia besnoiti TaxID=94643 RepID=A0A2A9MEI1_BESBE|nr:hypothetical protein BESB_033860 [Besnoitia besnoiti]PFH36928.1 hypothetical protein BESB_033860 [Besnoitia besnoiti]